MHDGGRAQEAQHVGRVAARAVHLATAQAVHDGALGALRPRRSRRRALPGLVHDRHAACLALALHRQGAHGSVEEVDFTELLLSCWCYTKMPGPDTREHSAGRLNFYSYLGEVRVNTDILPAGGPAQ